MERMCRNCGAIENMRVNFGDNLEAEREFHQEDWHDCENCPCTKKTYYEMYPTIFPVGSEDWGELNRTCHCNDIKIVLEIEDD